MLNLPPHQQELYFPMALLALGGILKELGMAAELWDFELHFKKAGNTSEKKFRGLLQHGIAGTDANIFGISAICSNFPMALWIAKEIKQYRPDSLIILGGPQPSSVPSLILDRFDFIDVVVVGEGELTLKEMALAGFQSEAFPKIPGIAHRSDGQAQFTHQRELIPQLDELPFPDYSLIDLQKYTDPKASSLMMNLEVGRGCPFNCSFCSTSLMWSKKFRVKSPQRILEEMKTLHKDYGAKLFNFIHDNFTTSKSFVRNFCHYMTQHNTEGFHWACSSRADCLSVAQIDSMQEAGLLDLFFGIESGSPRMQGIIKKNLHLESFEESLEYLIKREITATAAFILGFPEEEEEDIEQTVLKALDYRNLGAERVFFSKLSALSGTEIYHKYLDAFCDIAHPSSVSPQAYGLPYVTQLIEKYPDLFSSYYHVPHPKFSADFLWSFIEFAQLLVDGSPDLARSVLRLSHMSLFKLFRLWDSWAKAHNMSYYDDHRQFSAEDLRRHFPRFLDEMILEKQETTLQSHP